MTQQKIRLGDLLLNNGVITEDQLNRALRHVEQYGGRLGDALVKLDIITEDKLLAALRYHFNIPAVDLESMTIPPDIIRIVGKEMAKKHRIIPYKIIEHSNKKYLLVVMSNPTDLEAINDIQFASGMRVRPVLSKESEILTALKRYYDIPIPSAGIRKWEHNIENSPQTMSIIRGGEEVKIDNNLIIHEEREIERAKGDEEPDSNILAQKKEQILLRAIVKLMIEKGVFTPKELEEKLKKLE